MKDPKKRQMYAVVDCMCHIIIKGLLRKDADKLASDLRKTGWAGVGSEPYHPYPYFIKTKWLTYKQAKRQLGLK